MIRGVLDWMRPERSVRVRKMLGDVGQAAAGYMLGNLATSMIAGPSSSGRCGPWVSPTPECSRSG